MYIIACWSVISDCLVRNCKLEGEYDGIMTRPGQCNSLQQDARNARTLPSNYWNKVYCMVCLVRSQANIQLATYSRNLTSCPTAPLPDWRKKLVEVKFAVCVSTTDHTLPPLPSCTFQIPTAQQILANSVPPPRTGVHWNNLPTSIAIIIDGDQFKGGLTQLYIELLSSLCTMNIPTPSPPPISPPPPITPALHPLSSHYPHILH